MKYSELKSIVRHIKKHVNCSECSYQYRDKDIEVIGLIQDSLLVSLHCPKDNSNIVLQVGLVWDGDEVSVHHQMMQSDAAPITKDDILDMHNFLKNFDGDVESLFK